MKKSYQKPDLAPLGITVETGVMASSIETETQVKVDPYKDGFDGKADQPGFADDGSYIINF